MRINFMHLIAGVLISAVCAKAGIALLPTIALATITYTLIYYIMTYKELGKNEKL